jgi:putative DNA primase/helicase
VPFNVVIPKAERDRGLLGKLRAEWPGILARLVRGCLAWQRDGLGEPEAVTLATGEYRTAEDAVGRWISERLVVEPEGYQGEPYFTPWRDLLADYTRWCAESHEAELGGLKLGSALDRRGFQSNTKRHGGEPTKGRNRLSLRYDSPSGVPPV